MLKEDGLINNALQYLYDMLILNLCFVVTCLPIITIGTSVSSLYYTSFRYKNRKAEEDNLKLHKIFFAEFKKSFKETTKMFAMCLIVILGIAFNIWFTHGIDQYNLIEALMIFLLILVLIYMIFVFPVMSRFDNTLKKTFTNTVLLIFNNLGKSLMILLVVVGVLFIAFFNAYTKAFSMAFFVSIGVAFLIQLLIRYFDKIFQKYYEIE